MSHGIQHNRRRSKQAASSNSSSGSSTASDWSAVEPGGLLGRLQSSSPQQRPNLAVVLVHPQIPQNTGNIARSCAATGVPLHLVGPLGFQVDDKKLKRAGLDYWSHVCVKVHDSWEAFYEFFQALPGQQRLVGYSVYGDTYYAGPEFSYQGGDWLLFGAETTGLPMQAHTDIVSSGGCLVKIPIQDTYVRSLNQSVCVGVGLFEALRQLDSHAVAPRDDVGSPAVKRPTQMQLQQQQQVGV